jgi:hypothetical protein
MNMDRLPFEYGSAMYRPPVNPSDIGPMRHDRSMMSCHPKTIVLNQPDHRVVCATDSGSVFGYHIQHGLKIGRRAGDDA